jgi:hypothetical protein
VAVHAFLIYLFGNITAPSTAKSPVITTETLKIQRQPRDDVRKPPTTRPEQKPTAPDAAKKESAVVRSFATKYEEIIPTEKGTVIAVPILCSKLDEGGSKTVC